MIFLYGANTGSPIEARKFVSLFSILLVLLIIFAFVILIAFLMKKNSEYHKSDVYIEKEKNRKTQKKDVRKITKQAKLTGDEEEILWKICQVTNSLNICYLLKNTSDAIELFRTAYKILDSKKEFNQEMLYHFYNCLFKLELLLAQNKSIPSTKHIPLSSIIFYITPEGEQYPLTVLNNTKESLTVEIPDFLYKSRMKPELLVRTRFNYKNLDGLSYNFISRFIRYDVNEDGKIKGILAHTDQMQSQAHRHFKREFLQEKCIFSPVKINQNYKNDEDKYIYSEKIYMGKLTNISAGGCCVQTELPIKEKQNLCLILPTLGISEKIVGIIKKTRKLPNTFFALHIQFTKISLESKNRIFTLIYKFDI